MRFLQPPPPHDLTYSDVFLVPSRSDVGSRMAVDLAPDDGTGATLPIVAANMNSVTGPLLAATLARRGGLAVLTQDHDLDDTIAAIAWVKAQPVELASAQLATEDELVADVLLRVPAVEGHGIVVVRDDAYVGAIAARRLGQALPDARIGDLLHGSIEPLGPEDVVDARTAFDAVHARGVDFAAVVEDGRVLGTVSPRTALRSALYRPALDAEGRLRVAVAVSINGDPGAKASALVDAGADVVVIDTAHGHQGGMLRAIEAVRAAVDVPIVAGNVVTASAVRDLVQAGADILKVGVGPGAMCTTRMMTAVGRPQLSAVLETAEEAIGLGARVWADGGVRYPRDVALALAAGASSVMIGSWFAGTIEAPGRLQRDERGRLYKESWGMASTKAVRGRFGDLPAFELASKTLFAEGISSSTILLDPLRPSVEDLLDMITSGVRSSATYAGASSIAEFRERAVVGVQSAAGYEEGKALPVSW
ncbi:GuaB1 family IMP dehydrogenase-related protein [Agrococcus sp. SGAir0287]|uniref:GMP reductase n=1 Tax=Agrococcus sp. SGAir0287 TaxID=2070347 RepID=UPI0010CCD627|nr:GuaB1 family IMP dehydrogenase-related protein [Agrococcus sp. SGAir0287]QCR18951.1 GuaB1 family IMP dehydrogenase-related protein [Agrococcus sp. SGAir0287]